MSNENSETKQVAKLVITSEALCDLIGVNAGSPLDYSIVDASFDDAIGTIHLTFTGPGFRPIAEGAEAPVITASINADGSGKRTFSWGEYLS